MNDLPRIGYSKEEWKEDSPFHGDKFEREEVAKRLTSLIDRMASGAVISIDAPWGEGKTFFGRNWALQLGMAGRKVAYIDAFEQDYIEDPFLLIASEIAVLMKGQDELVQEFKDGAVAVMKAVLPIATKSMVNVAAKIALSSMGIPTGLSGAMSNSADSVADGTEAWLRKRIDDHDKEKQALRSFKDKLTEFSVMQEKKVVIFVDELDRCRPDYAISLIERLKHFFYVPNVVFVLLINRQQLERAVKGVYGPDTDAELYLGKFINLNFCLPKIRSDESERVGFVGRYIEHVLNKYEFRRDNWLGDFSDGLEDFSCLYELSLRDVERCIALYACAQPLSSGGILSAYLIGLKVVRPSIFDGIVRVDKEVHKSCRNLIVEYIQRIGEENSTRRRRLSIIEAWHRVAMTGFTVSDDDLNNYISSFGSYRMMPKRLTTTILSRIDLSVS